MRAQFVLSEVLIGLRRNLTMNIAVMITVAVSLTAFGASLLVNAQAATMKDYWYDRIEVSIFLEKSVSQEQREQLQEELAAKPEVQQVFYESKDEAYERFKVQFKDSPALVENVRAEDLPESFRVKLVDPSEFDVIASEFANKPGVDTVLNQREVLRPFFNVLSKLQWGTLVFALMSLLAAAVLIGNTVRLAAFSRRRETSIMRLVGASNLYIQLPFLLEGAIAGFVGAVMAGLAMAAIKTQMIDALRGDLQFTAFVGWSAVRTVVPILILLGVLMSAIASFLTLRRYLRV